MSSNIHELPQDIRVILESQGINSVLIYPLIIDGKEIGFMGCDVIQYPRTWNQKERDVLKTIALIIGNLLDKDLIYRNLESNQIKYLQLFNFIDEMVIISNKKGDILFANNLVADKLGFSNEELKHKTIFDLHPQESIEFTKVIIQELITRKRKNCSFEMKTKLGKIINVETTASLVMWDGNEVIFCFSHDMSMQDEALTKFIKLFEINPALMAVNSVKENKFVEVNQSFLKTLGYKYEDIIGKSPQELNLFQESSQHMAEMEKFIKHGSIHNVEINFRTKDNEIKTGLFSGEIIQSQGIQYYLTVMVDITEQKRLFGLYEAERTRYHSVILGAHLGTWEWNIQTGELILNNRWAEMLGYNLVELQPISVETFKKLTQPEDLAKAFKLIDQHFKEETPFYEVEFRMKHKNGQWFWIQAMGTTMSRDTNGNPLWMFGIHFDINNRKKIELEKQDYYYRDPLTNIYNRGYIINLLSQKLDQSIKDKKSLSIAIIDLDNFKQINDTYGHLAGDDSLKELVKIVGENLRTFDLFGRYGGEEFLIVSYSFDRNELNKVLSRILRIVKSHDFYFGNQQFQLSFSGGISDLLEFDFQEIKVEEIIKRADERLRLAKQSGKGRIIY